MKLKDGPRITGLYVANIEVPWIVPGQAQVVATVNFDAGGAPLGQSKLEVVAHEGDELHSAVRALAETIEKTIATARFQEQDGGKPGE